jgi:hypothetical protein
LNWRKDIRQIEIHIKARRSEIAELLQVCSGTKLDREEEKLLLDDLRECLVRFIADCAALPLRSPNQLIATMRKIGSDPNAFNLNSDDYDPEANYRVLSAYSQISEANRKELIAFELDEGTLDPTELYYAAQLAIRLFGFEVANRQRGIGRPVDDLQNDLARNLALIFVARGGSLGRTVHDIETGPFHRFLELVLEPVRQHAHRAKSSLTINSMVRHAQRDLDMNSPEAGEPIRS